MWMLFLFAIFYTLKSRFKFQFCHCFWALLNQNCLMLGEISLWNFLVLGCGFGGKYDEYFLCLFWCIWRECNSQTFKEEELSIKILRSLSSPLWSGEEYNGGCRIAHYSILSWFKLRLGGFVLSFLLLIFYFWLLLWCILCTLVYNLHAYPKILSEFRSSVAI